MGRNARLHYSRPVSASSSRRCRESPSRISQPECPLTIPSWSTTIHRASWCPVDLSPKSGAIGVQMHADRMDVSTPCPTLSCIQRHLIRWPWLVIDMEIIACAVNSTTARDGHGDHRFARSTPQQLEMFIDPTKAGESERSLDRGTRGRSRSYV
jgi:hypothetical protein